MLTCLSAIQGDFSLTGDPKNCNLELSITWLTQLWPVPGCCTGKCLPRQEQVYWICRLSEFILPKPVPVSTTVCTQADHGVLTQLEKQQRHSVSSLTTRFVRTHTDGHLAFMEGQEENTQTARPQYGVHTSCHVKNVNWILASKQKILFFHWRYSPLWAVAVEQSPSIFSYLSPTLSIFSLPSLSTSSFHTLMGKTDNTFSKNNSFQLSADTGK